MKKTIAILLVALVGMAGVFAADQTVKVTLSVAGTLTASWYNVESTIDNEGSVGFDTLAAPSGGLSGEKVITLKVTSNHKTVDVSIKGTALVHNNYIATTDDNKLIDLTLTTQSNDCTTSNKTVTFTSATADEPVLVFKNVITTGDTAATRTLVYDIALSREADWDTSSLAGGYTATLTATISGS